MVKQIVGDFVACNRVTIEKGCSKIIFKYLKHQRTLLKNGFGGELGAVVISTDPISPDMTPASPPHDGRSQRTKAHEPSKYETTSSHVSAQVDAMSCSDGSSSARSWQNHRRGGRVMDTRS